MLYNGFICKVYEFVDDTDDFDAIECRLAFGDFSYYWIADREGFAFKRLNELFAATGQVVKGVNRIIDQIKEVDDFDELGYIPEYKFLI